MFTLKFTQNIYTQYPIQNANSISQKYTGNVPPCDIQQCALLTLAPNSDREFSLFN